MDLPGTTSWKSPLHGLAQWRCEGHALLEASPAVLQTQTEGIGGEGGVPEVLNVGFFDPVEDLQNLYSLHLQHDNHVGTKKKHFVCKRAALGTHTVNKLGIRMKLDLVPGLIYEMSRR
jgi:hypothetical protein